MEFGKISKEDLPETLRLFYPSARQRPKKGSTEELGPHYQRQSLVYIRSAINCYLQIPPFNHTWDLMKDKEFKCANKVFSGNLVVQKAQGSDTSSSHHPISPDHLNQIFENYLLPQ